jgi:hypothetical protein
VSLPVFKTGVARHPGQAGSIPVRLRHHWQLGGDDIDQRREVPRTDAVLADARLVSAVTALGQATVKGVVAGAQERARRGEAGIAAEAVPTAAVVGGGGAPDVELPSWGVALAAGLAEPLRAKAVVGRVEHGRLLCDLRCVPLDRDGDVYAAVWEA